MEEAFKFWTEHSERNWLVSLLLAVLGVPPNERNFIGRWNITTSADEYLRTSQQVLVTLQEKVVASLGGEDRWGLRESGIDELIQSIVEKGGSVELAAQQRKVLWLDPKFAGGLGLEPTFPDPAEAAVAPPEECQDTDECCSPSDCGASTDVMGAGFPWLMCSAPKMCGHCAASYMISRANIAGGLARTSLCLKLRKEMTPSSFK